MKNKLVLATIGAGEGALPILDRAKKLDYVTTLAFGHNDSLAKHLADIFIEADIFNTEFIVTKCREYGVNGVIGTSETTTEQTAVIADKLGLPGNEIKGGFGAHDKYVMRKRVSSVTTINQPKFELYSPESRYQYPVVVKALDSCGKKGVSIAHDPDELKDAVEYARRWSSNGRVLIEEYLEGGKEYSIECLVGNGLYEVIQYTEKDSAGPPHFTEKGHHQPADLSDGLRARIRVAVTDVLKALGIRCGLAHLELKIIKDVLYFIEVGARGGGDHIADTLTVNSTDFDYFKAAIDACLGRYEHHDVHNVAYTGIYFHCKDNSSLQPIFEKAKTADWCISNTVKDNAFCEASSNVETANSGYIIYKYKEKITVNNI